MELANLNQQKSIEIKAGFDTQAGFELLQRQARALASSTIVPSQYRNVIEKKKGYNVELQDNPSGHANCIVALNMATRLNADPLMVMQNLYIIEGRPSWSSQFIIASINACGKFTPLRFKVEDLGEKTIEYSYSLWENGSKQNKTEKIKIHDYSCIAYAQEKGTDTILESSKITVEMAVKEGWYTKNGSKWQTMPEVMLRYRASAFFGKIYAPELLMGLSTVEETNDIIDVTPIVIENEENITTIENLQESKEENKETIEEIQEKLSKKTTSKPKEGKKEPVQEPIEIHAQETIFCEREQDKVFITACTNCHTRESCPSHQ